jgi:hypothetical protein
MRKLEVTIRVRKKDLGVGLGNEYRSKARKRSLVLLFVGMIVLFGAVDDARTNNGFTIEFPGISHA